VGGWLWKEEGCCKLAAGGLSAGVSAGKPCTHASPFEAELWRWMRAVRGATLVIGEASFLIHTPLKP
jgi:hypothetical protein